MEERMVQEKQWLTNVITTTLVKNPKFLNDYNEETAATFHIRDVQLKVIGSDEAFMLTICYRASVSFEHLGAVQQRSLVIKKTPELPEELYNDINFDTLFNNEILSYTKILPAFAEIANNGFHSIQFFHAESAKKYACIILEDFTPDGWGVAKKNTNLSLEHVMLTVKYLAKFHACGFAMRHTQRENFDTLVSSLKESRYAKSTIHPDYDLALVTFGTRLKIATEEHQPTVPQALIQHLWNMQQKPMRNQKERVTPVEPVITLCHGDFLRNNIAYKYKDENREIPIDVMMFDLQTLRVGSPMIDLTIFLNLSAYTEVRHKHFDSIFTTYCNELADAFRVYSKSDTVPEYLSYDVLIKEYIRLLPYSVSIAVSFLPALVEPLDIPIQELMMQVRTPDEIKEEALTRGGIEVDKEVAHQVKELYDLMTKYKLDVFEGCNY